MSEYNTKSSNKADLISHLQEKYGLFSPDSIIIIISLFVVGLILFKITTPIPTGADPGNWLYISHQMGKMNDWFVPPYPPLTPLFLKIFEFIWGTLLGLKIFGLFSLVFLGFSTYFLIKPLKMPLLIIPASISIIFIEYNMEIFSWGGYPQLLASGFAILSMISFNYFIINPTRMKAISTALLISLVINSSILVSVFLIISLMISLIIQFFTLKIELLAIIKKYSLYFLFSLLILSLSAMQSMILTFQQSELPLGVQGFQNIFGVLNYVFSSNKIFWILLCAISIITMLVSSDRYVTQLKIIFTSILLSSLILMTVLNEPRFGSFLQFGIILIPLILIRQIKNINYFRNKNLNKIISPILMLIITVIFVINIKNGIDHYNEASIYYKVVDESTIKDLEWIKDNININAIIACQSYNIHGDDVPLGWWVEGYSERRTLVGSDPKWMSFSVEKNNALLVKVLFDNSVKVEDKISTMKTHNISYLIIDTRNNYVFDNIQKNAYFKEVYSNQIRIYMLNN